MKRKLLVAILATILCLSVALLAACGCEHWYEDGICTKCGVADPDYDPNNAPHTHFYVQGSCNVCGEVDPNYVPPAAGDGEDKYATSINKAVRCSKDGDQLSLAGTVFAVDTNGYYIYDGTASIFVQDATTVAVGDVVYAQGTLSLSGLNKAVLEATSSQVLQSGQESLQPTKLYVVDLGKASTIATNYYKFINLVGNIAEENGVYSIVMDDQKVLIDPSNAELFQNIVGQKVTATVVVVDYTSTWVVKVVTQNAVEVTPADLDLVADEIFTWVATQVPADTFDGCQLPTLYVYEPSVNFAWSTTAAGATVDAEGKLAIAGITEDTTIPLTLTLTCDGKTKTHDYSVSSNADDVFEYLEGTLPTIYPNELTLPTTYSADADVAFAWTVENGTAIEIQEKTVTEGETEVTKTVLVSQDVKEDTTVQIRATLTKGTNSRSKVFNVVLKAPISVGLADVASQALHTPVKVSGTVLMTAYNQTKSVYSVLIYDTNCNMLQVNFGSDANAIANYGEGDAVSVYGRVSESTVAGITIKSLSVKEVTVDQKAATDYQFSLTGFNVVNLSTADDYNAFMANVESYGGTTIVKISAPYMVYSGSSSYNFVRFGPDAISARDGYSTTINGATKKRVFCFARNIMGEKCPGLETALAVPKKSAGAKLYSSFEIYAVPMYMGSDTLQFIPLGASFYQYNK